jgi:hypothetical protein
MRVSIMGALLLAFSFLAGTPASAVPAVAATPSFTAAACVADAARDPWAVQFGAATRPAPLALPAVPPALAFEDQGTSGRRPVAFEYSEGYRTRAAIHKYASFATIPLFAANYFVGQRLYDNRANSSMKDAHAALVAGSAALFGVNTVTGIWNLWEARKDPDHRGRRMTHGILMLVADVGFLATAAMAPEGEHERGGVATAGTTPSASSHRAVALSSMGIATVSYLIMLLGGH